MPLTENFIRRPVATIMLNLAILVFGLIGLTRLPVRELPDIDPSVVTVLTVYPGASAEIVETEVTERLEESISGADSIKVIRSESREQVSSITVEFLQGRDVDLAAQDVRDLVSRVRGQLPEDIDEPVISKQDSGAQPIIWVAFFSELHSTEELTYIADTLVKDRLQTVPGVSSVILGGEKRYAMRIRLDAQLMAAHDITVLDVARVLEVDNVELPSGRVENRDRELAVRTMGELKTAEDFNRLVLRQDAHGTIRLEDVGLAEMGVEDERSRARFKGRPAIGLGIVRQSKSNTLKVADGVKAQMAELAPLLPKGVEFDFPYDESIYVGNAVKEVWQTLAIAFGLVVLTIFLFLRSIRSTFVPTLAIPVSVGATFGVLYLLGLTVNIFTLLALVLAIGIVVDDAIVVLENIHRHIEDGMKPFDAAITGIREIAFAVVATTLSLVAVFLPLAFIGGITGRLLLEFAVALCAAVVVSSIVALTLTPMAAARLLKPIEKEKHGRVYNWLERKFDRLNERYERGLNWSLRHRGVIVLIAFLSLLLSGFFFMSLEKEFLPEEDKGRFMGLIMAPEGSTPEYTDRMVRQVETIFSQEPDIKTYFTAVALPFNGPGDPKMGITFVRLQDGKRKHVRDLMDGPTGIGGRLFGEVEGAFAFAMLPKAVDIGFSQPFELVISHPNLDRLNAYTQQLIERFRHEGYLANARSPFEMNKPQVDVKINRDRAADLGISIRDISRTLQILFGGVDLSTIKLDGKQYDVIAQLNQDNRLTPGQMDQVYVRTAMKDLVPLSSVIDTEETAAPTVIERFGRQRSATIEATPAGVPLGTAVKRTEAILAETLPPEFTYSWKGEARDLKESSTDIYGFMLLAIIVVYMVLAAQFESFVSPFVVMLALPLAMLGAFGALYLLSGVNFLGNMMYGWANYATDPPAIAGILSSLVPRIPAMNINIFSQVGLILLIGLVTKNSILLVEFANQKRAKGLDAKQAMLKAGLIRLRPILMTSMATIMGILPIAIGFGEAGESRRPMGVVTVGGLVTSTFLTLFVIPVMYTLLADAGKFFRRKNVVVSFLVLFFASSLTLQAEPLTFPQKLSLKEAVTLALEHNPGLKEADFRVAQEKGVHRELTAAGRPRITINQDYNIVDPERQQSFGSDRDPDNTRWTADAEAALTVYSAGRNTHAKIASGIRSEAEESARVALQNDLVTEVHEVYYAAQLAREEERVQQQAIDVLTEQLRFSERREAAGVGTRFEVMQAEVALANAKPPLFRAHNAYRSAIDDLHRLIALPYGKGITADKIEIDPQQRADEIEIGLAAAVTSAAEKRPELEELQLRVRAAREELVNTERGQRPVVDVYAGYGAETEQFDSSEILKGWTAGLRLTWALFDGGKTAGRSDQASAQAAQLFQQERSLLLNIESEVRQAFYDYEEAASILETSALVIGQAEEALRLAKNRYEADQGTQLEVLESQLQLTQSRLEEATALHDLQRASIRLQRAMGTEL